MSVQERVFGFSRTYEEYEKSLKEVIKRNPDASVLLDRFNKEPTQCINVRQALREGTIKPLNSPLLGGGFDEEEPIEDSEKEEEIKKENS